MSDRPPGILERATRHWLPGGIAVLGVALVVVGHAAYSSSADTHSLETATGVGLLLVASMVWMFNWLYRLSIRSNDEREEEERAREHFDRTGRWPEDERASTRNGHT